MTAAARTRRAIRHSNEGNLMQLFGMTRAGKTSTVGSVKAAARKILRSYTAKQLRMGLQPA